MSHTARFTYSHWWDGVVGSRPVWKWRIRALHQLKVTCFPASLLRYFATRPLLLNSLFLSLVVTLTDSLRQNCQSVSVPTQVSVVRMQGSSLLKIRKGLNRLIVLFENCIVLLGNTNLEQSLPISIVLNTMRGGFGQCRFYRFRDRTRSKS